MADLESGYDYIIVGSGSAGCVMANRLSADPAVRVLLLEAGGEDSGFWLKLPVGYFRSIYDSQHARLFKTDADPGIAGRQMDCPRGQVVGGSSSINGLIFIRGQHQDFDDWAAAGASGWDFENVLPAFKRLERYAGGDPAYRGRDGELSVSDLRNQNPLCDAWLAAANATGLPPNDDFNGESTFGVGRYQLSIDGHWRASASRAFLKPVRNRPNLTVLTNAPVSRVLFKGTRATGVEWVRQGQPQQAMADQEVILCAGAIQSPQLLQLSGVGPAKLLQELGIPIVADREQVGMNLQDHMQMRTVFRLRGGGSLNQDVRNPLSLAKMGAQWLFGQSGPLTVGAGQVGGGAASPLAKNGRPDLQFIVMPLSVDKPGMPLHKYRGFTSSVWQCHPSSRGRVAIRSTDPLANPSIQCNYLSTEHDRQTMIEGVRMTREIAAQSPFRQLWEEEIIPGEREASDDASVLAAIQKYSGTVYHVCGTSRMGSDTEAVVDPMLRVNGVERLRVIDASVMPQITSANTNAATLMIGERGAEIVRQSARP
ncbi:MAG: GMC family oxidoreductase [Burkholderiaceae bacterium]